MKTEEQKRLASYEEIQAMHKRADEVDRLACEAVRKVDEAGALLKQSEAEQNEAAKRRLTERARWAQDEAERLANRAARLAEEYGDEASGILATWDTEAFLGRMQSARAYAQAAVAVRSEAR
jgi:hypothetical protein